RDGGLSGRSRGRAGRRAGDRLSRCRVRLRVAHAVADGPHASAADSRDQNVAGGEIVLPKTRGIGMTSQRTRDRMVARLREKGIRDEAVLAAMAAIPRHIFIEEALASRAYEDTALPIGFEQTISQPFVVARMIEALRGEVPLGNVLEIGTGCGYQ